MSPASDLVWLVSALYDYDEQIGTIYGTICLKQPTIIQASWDQILWRK